MLIRTVIGLLAAVALVLLYRAMLREQAMVDPGAPLDAKKILAVLRLKHMACDNVVSYTPLGKTKDGTMNAYLARCGDGGHYVYFQNATRYGATTCLEQAFGNNYRCPE
jgi:hypothetical protein